MEGRRENGEVLHGAVYCGPVPGSDVRLVHLTERFYPA